MRRVLVWGRHGSEALAALMLAALFFTFLLQIYSRYVMVEPLGWTLELCLVLWIWIVFYGNAFLVRERDHVSFDILYLAAPRFLRRIFALISAACIAAALAISLLPTWDWIDFLMRKPSATLRLPTGWIYSVYALFIVVVVLRYVWSFFDVLMRGPHDEDHEIAHEAHDAADRPEALR